MANEGHLALLREQGVLGWNKWRQNNPKTVPDLNNAGLSGADLRNANFVGVHLCEADLDKANLSMADLSKANLGEAELTEANLSKAKLKGTYLEKACLNWACVTMADLRGADLSTADLFRTDFSGANLTGADLSRTQALGTNFIGAKLTGACIEEWHTNEATNLADVDCQYIYLKSEWNGLRKKVVYYDQCPNNGVFAPGEFTKRFHIIQNVIELAFRDGVPWKAFSNAFNELNVQVLDEYGAELFLQEYKVLGGGLVMLKVCYPTNANKDKIKNFLERRTYELELKVATLEGEVEAKDFAFEKLVRVLEAPKVQVDHITTLNVQIGETNSMSGDRNVYTGGGNYVESNHGTYIEGDQNIYASDQRQSLTEVIVAIQQLLDYLEQPSQTSISAQQVAEQAATRHPALRDPQIVELAVKNTPTLQMRLRSALTAMGIETVKVIFAPAGIPIEGVKAWLQPEQE
jgi:uncharacterized protein YjbI with pentapeptide repeats